MRATIFLILFLYKSLLIFAQAENGLVAKYSFNKGDANDEVTGRIAKAIGVLFVDDRLEIHALLVIYMEVPVATLI